MKWDRSTKIYLQSRRYFIKRFFKKMEIVFSFNSSFMKCNQLQFTIQFDKETRVLIKKHFIKTTLHQINPYTCEKHLKLKVCRWPQKTPLCWQCFILNPTIVNTTIFGNNTFVNDACRQLENRAGLVWDIGSQCCNSFSKLSR